MKFRKIFIILLCAVSVISFLDADTMEVKRGRPYDIEHDIGFRWRTTLDVKYGGVRINSDVEHIRLKACITACNSIFSSNNANIAASSLQVVFKDSHSLCVPIQAIVYTKHLKNTPEKTRVNCFSTACLTVGEGDQANHPPITYKNRGTFDLSIPFMFKAIGMNTDCVKTAPGSHFHYDYRDTEFQIVHELFSSKEYGFVPGKNRMERGSFQPIERKTRFMELFTSLISGNRIEDVALIILHIHSRFDPCSVCAEMLCKLSRTLNYQPEALIQNRELCQRLRKHDIQFLIEVSSDEPYWNAREAGLDSFYMRQLSDIPGLGQSPIAILSAERFPSQDQSCSFPPLVVFRRMSLPVVLDSIVINDVEIQATSNKEDK